MAKVVVTGQVDELEAWEKGFRSVPDLLNLIYISPISLGINTGDNSFAYVAEVKDVDQFLAVIESDKAKNAQKANGVIDGTIRYYVLEKDVTF